MTEELAGSLRDRVTVEKRTSARDLAGGAKVFWSYDGATWVRVTPLIPASLAEADSLSARPRWQVMLRKREGIGLDSRFIWRTKFLHVESVTADPRFPGFFTCICKEQRG